jgi:putative transposase
MTVRDSATAKALEEMGKEQRKWEYPSLWNERATRPQEGIPMSAILPTLRFAVKQRLLRNLSRCRHAALKIHYLIIVNLVNGRQPKTTADLLAIHRSTVYRVAQRFRSHGESGLFDRRANNGPHKLSPAYLKALERAVRACPQDYRWSRPTWTRQLLVRTLRRQTGITIHVGTMSRALRRIKARRGRPRPTVRPPKGQPDKRWRLYRIRRLLATLPADEVAVYADEVDIHLNPKIGWDWMGYGQQKEVPTPGQNEKRYLAGALDARTGELLWVGGRHKDSSLFLRLLGLLWQHYRQAQVIHVIVDNYKIHDSALVRWALAGTHGRMKLHFLPPYSPKHNKIERVWEDVHGNVTRNHRCADIDTLMRQVYRYLRRRLRTLQHSSWRAAA